MLPQSPLGAYTDSQYLADNAALRSNIAKQYADVLKQLGYVDPDTGQFIMGSVESEAQRQQADLNRSIGLADEQTTQQHQGLGTLFSGLRGTDQARAEYPFINSLSQLATQTPLTLSDLYEQGAGLMDQYNVQNNQLLASAAGRAAQAITQSPPDVTPPPATPPPPAAAAPIGGVQARSGGPVVDASGGYYDPQRSIYVTAGGQTPKVPAQPRTLINPPESQLVHPVAPGRVQIINGRTVVR
jgi:hypothetical protein